MKLPVKLLSLLGLTALHPRLDGSSRLAQNPAPQEVASLLVGIFESTEQALAARSEFIPVRLTQCPVRMIGAPESFAERDSIFLYTEQAVTYALKGPYRQRFTVLESTVVDDWQVSSTVYRPEDPNLLIGLCSKPEAQRTIQFSEIGKRECTVMLKRLGEAWSGLTPGQGCESSYLGAVRVTSKVSLSADGLDSWDQGWAADGTQVWGAETGPYKFRHIDEKAVDSNIDQISWRLSGHMTNAEQVRADSSFAPVDYVLCPVHIKGSPWAASTRSTLVKQSITLPGGNILVRKRVYVVSSNGLESRQMDFFELSEQAAANDTCALTSETRFIDYAELRDSQCTMDFTWSNESRAYVGKTREGGCASSYKGSKSLSIQGVLGAAQLQIWEQWFDADGIQVAGSKVGPYIYKLSEDE